MIQNGFFITIEGVTFALVNGSMYELEATDTLKNLQPGYYNNKLEPVDEEDDDD